MKSLVILSLGALIAVATAEADDSRPQPTPIQNPGEMEEPALPTPEATPGDGGPTVLPESNELPARPRTEQPARASFERVSTGTSSAQEARFDEIRSTAMSNPRAVYLLKRARNSSSAAARRTYLREYYSTVAARMRRLDPELKSSIDAYEEAKVHEITASSSSAKKYSHRSSSHRTANSEAHHRSRRVSTRRHHERMIIIYDPYYPYGPYMPPYSPPVVFDPW
ncbi:MAG: hypothetical protein JO151_07400 [Verrucomicrobia bacterium]|nr:hypothetical protein [Verrucomicrobiota bacterium]